MIEQMFDTLNGLKAPIQVYADQAEAEAVEVGGMFKQGTNNLAYRQVLPSAREIICNMLEEQTKIERNSKVVGKTKAGKDILQWEADGAYTKRVMAEKSWEDLTAFQSDFETRCRNVPENDEPNSPTSPLAIDLKGTVRTVTPKQLPVKYKLGAAYVITEGSLAKLNVLLAATINKQFTPSNDQTKTYTGSYPKNVNGVETQVPFSVSEKDALDLGKLLKERADWKAAQEAKEFQDALA